MNENINLYEILKGHEGETFYSPVLGYIKYEKSSLANSYITWSTKHGQLDTDKYGKYDEKSNEIIAFPSKDQRDWNKWVEEQKPRTPKTWSELIEYTTPSLFCEIFPKSDGNYITVIEDYGNSLIEKSALALLKIHQLIEVGYGGNVSYEEWSNYKSNCHYTVEYDSNDDEFEIVTASFYKSHIAFHTKEQAEEFLSSSENIQLLKDYFMI